MREISDECERLFNCSLNGLLKKDEKTIQAIVDAKPTGTDEQTELDIIKIQRMLTPAFE